MGIFEIISAIVLIIACVFIIIVVLMQDTKTQMSKTISGTSSDNYFGKNSGRTKEAMLNKAMTTAAIVFFVLAIIVNVVNVYFGGSKNDESSDVTSSISSDVDNGTADTSAAGTSETGTADTGSEPAAGTAEAGSQAESAPETAQAAQTESESTANFAESTAPTVEG